MDDLGRNLFFFELVYICHLFFGWGIGGEGYGVWEAHIVIYNLILPKLSSHTVDG